MNKRQTNQLKREFRQAVYEISQGNLYAGIYMVCAGVMYLGVATMPPDGSVVQWLLRSFALLLVISGVWVIILSVRKLIKYG